MVVRKVGLTLGLALCVLTTAAVAQRPSSAASGGAAAMPSAAELRGEPWFSPPMLRTADIDSTTAPCDDFHQFAAGRWDDHPPPHPWDFGHGLISNRLGKSLWRFLEQAPALALTTTDVVTQVLGSFYGSCLADATGTAEGAVGDSARTQYCFKTTRRYLDPALFEVVVTRVWTPAARAESRQLWELVKAAAYDRIRASAAVSDSSKQQLLKKIAAATVQMSNTYGDKQGLLLLPFLDSVAAPRTYPSYAGLGLSPTNFVQNLTRVQARADTLSSLRQTVVSPFLDLILPQASGFLAGWDKQRNRVHMEASAFIPPVVSGAVDAGGWYGMIGALLAHELTHGFDPYFLTAGQWLGPQAKEQLDERLRMFMQEQLGEQFRPLTESQSFQDQIGILVAYDAFERAMRGRPQPRIDGFTPEQRFFIGVAQFINYATGWRKEAVWTWRYDVNGTLSVMPGFARAFGCKAGSPMAGSRIWYRDPRPPRSVPRPSGEMTEGEWQYAVDWRSAMWFLGSAVESADLRSALETLRAKHEAERHALTDSLGLTAPGAVPVSRWQRTSSLFVRQLGEVRSVLTPAQQAIFDAQVRTWLTQYTEPSWKVTIPWLAP